MADYQTFNKAKFEQDVSTFLAELFDGHQELAYLRQKPPIVLEETIKAAQEGIIFAVISQLAKQTGGQPHTLPDPLRYHQGTFFNNVDIEMPVYERLIKNKALVQHLFVEGLPCSLEVRCGGILEIVAEEYKGRFGPKWPESFEIKE